MAVSTRCENVFQTAFCSIIALGDICAVVLAVILLYYKEKSMPEEIAT